MTVVFCKCVEWPQTTPPANQDIATIVVPGAKERCPITRPGAAPFGCRNTANGPPNHCNTAASPACPAWSRSAFGGPVHLVIHPLHHIWCRLRFETATINLGQSICTIACTVYSPYNLLFKWSPEIISMINAWCLKVHTRRLAHHHHAHGQGVVWPPRLACRAAASTIAVETPEPQREPCTGNYPFRGIISGTYQ